MPTISRHLGRAARAALAILALGAPLAAQVPPGSWIGQTSDNGSLIFGVARTPDHGLSIECTAPSPRGLPLFQTGSHEAHRTGPFGAFIGFGDLIFDWSPPYVQRGVVMSLGDTSYRLPDIAMNELQGTALMVPMTTSLLRDLRTAPSLSLRTPQGVVHRFPVAGLTAALDTALGACIDRWVAMGQPRPAGLGWPAASAGATAPQPPAPGIPRFNLPGAAASPPPAPGVIPRFALPGAAAPGAPTGIAGLPATIPAQVRALCGGQARIADAALRAAEDFDADGVADYVINYADVICARDSYPTFCGAANCLIQVFMSSKGYAVPFEFLAIEVEPATAPNGRRGLRMHATPALCADGACDGVWLWDGLDFRND